MVLSHPRRRLSIRRRYRSPSRSHRPRRRDGDDPVLLLVPRPRRARALALILADALVASPFGAAASSPLADARRGTMTFTRLAHRTPLASSFIPHAFPRAHTVLTRN